MSCVAFIVPFYTVLYMEISPKRIEPPVKYQQRENFLTMQLHPKLNFSY